MSVVVKDHHYPGCVLNCRIRLAGDRAFGAVKDAVEGRDIAFFREPDNGVRYNGTARQAILPPGKRFLDLFAHACALLRAAIGVAG